ncbi:hypothetical protein HCA69_10010 [Listeria grandensis]|uniref:Polymerase/histidinol phosphatase N-terminal domain-containing protein n=1 Tax=Listeria grandensis TaxID=1494963 RepID=A0A7X1CQ63_9LIST|nr:DUF6282 family protein [Listeria grandensis]MBC1936701.1 hypothetical protein [Listeria grandensis]
MSKIGSIWRRWDLHVHTASSFDYKYKKSDSNEALAAAWKKHGIEAVAITDHFKIDADRIEALRKLAPNVEIFPGVELRTDKGNTNVHIIAIFSSLMNLTELQSDFEVIMLREKSKARGNDETIFWDYNDIVEFVKNRDGIISIHASGKSNGIDTELDNRSLHSMSVKEDYAKSVNIFEVNNQKGVSAYKEQVFKKIHPRPVIICSDNHDPFDYRFNEKLWIKADLTFRGLKQAIEHPDERIFVGDEPPKITHQNLNAQYIIDSISISKNNNCKNTEHWFNSDLTLNPALVTIIGNKGSGKSALSDILGLIGSATNLNNDVASFLNNNRFNRNPKKFAKDYNVSLKWLDGHIDTLDSLEITSTIEQSKVQYLPQKYIENICSNLDDGFQDEINGVLFTYLDESQKLGAKSFDEFISKRTNNVNLTIADLKEKIQNKNSTIISLENKMKKSYITSLKQQEQELQDELKRQVEQEPTPVQKPENVENTTHTSKIEEIDKQLKDLQKEVDSTQKTINKYVNAKLQTNNLKTKIELVISRVDEINTEVEQELKLMELDDDTSLFQIKYDNPVVKFDQLLKSQEKMIAAQKLLIDASNLDSFVFKQKKLLKEKQGLIDQSTAETKAYQKYLSDYGTWEKSINKIKDCPGSENTISYITKEIEYIENTLTNEYATLLSQRSDLIEKLYKSKLEIVAIYKDIYSPIDADLRPILSDFENGISFSSSLKRINFTEKFLPHINKQHQSLFSGVDNARLQMQRLFDDIDLNSFDSLKNFIDGVIDGCNLDDNYDKLDNVVKDKHALYRLLCELDYVDVDYSLTLDNKDLTQLSPGERGLVLLVFYLVLSKDKLPIIIDQPEDNLDNQSIFSKLVPCIQAAKLSRQVIIVTHNPNIAVACDSEQIIVADIDKTNSTITYVTGSIEDEQFNLNLINILEGTQPAFNLRERKYILTTT